MVKTKRDIVTKLPTVRDKIQILQRDNVVKLPASKDIKLETAASTKEDVKMGSGQSLEWTKVKMVNKV